MNEIQNTNDKLFLRCHDAVIGDIHCALELDLLWHLTAMLNAVECM